MCVWNRPQCNIRACANTLIGCKSQASVNYEILCSKTGKILEFTRAIPNSIDVIFCKSVEKYSYNLQELETIGGATCVNGLFDTRMDAKICIDEILMNDACEFQPISGYVQALRMGLGVSEIPFLYLCCCKGLILKTPYSCGWGILLKECLG